MHPLNNGSQVENVPAPKPRVGTAGYFSESNDSGAPSYPGQDWFNAVIREFQTALAVSGVAFDPDKFDHLQKMITNASNGTRNLFEANQNFNVEGADGTLTSTSQTFTDGQEFSYGWFVTGGADLVDVKIVDGEVTATSGKIRRSYDKDPAGLITAASVYGSVTDKSGIQIYADTLLTNGVEVSEDGSNVYLTVDFGVYTSGISIAALSHQRGIVGGISDDESERAARGGFVLVQNADCTMKILPDNSVIVIGSVVFTSSPDQSSKTIMAPLPFAAISYSALVNTINPATRAANVTASGANITVTYGTTTGPATNTVSFTIFGRLI